MGRSNRGFSVIPDRRLFMRVFFALVSLLAFTLTMWPCPIRAQGTHPVMHVRIARWTPEAERKIRSIPHIDILGEESRVFLNALVYPEDLPLLRHLGFKPVVVHEDIEAFYASRLTQPGTTTLKRGSMGGYLTWTEILSQLDQWRTRYPKLITVRQSIGKTFEKRDQWIVKVSANADVDENEPEIYMESLIHAREPGGMMSGMRCIEYLMENYGKKPVVTDLLDNREIWYLPVMNVDGYEYNRSIRPGGGGMWRKNRNGSGIDLNRNFGYKWGYDNRGSSPSPGSGTYRGTGPFSEPAAKNVEKFILSRSTKGMTMAWDIHSYGGLCMFPFSYANVQSPRHSAYVEMSAEMVKQNKYRAGIANTTLYPMNGAAVDWFEGSAGLWGWLPELGRSFWPATSRILALAEENLHMFLTAIKYAGPYLITQSLTVKDLGNPNGVVEPGEKIEVTVTVRNRGVLTAANAQARLVTATPYARVEVGNASLGNIPRHTDANNSGNPLRALIPEYTAPGTRLALEVHYTFNGHTLREPLDIIVGTPRVVVNDTCESATWTRGVPGDDATTGIWTWGDPYLTTAFSNSYVVQTGNDHTPGSGRYCYVTGNLATSNGDADDVDNGKTTLVTPDLNLSTARNPYVEFWRWYMDHGPEPNNDVFVVSVSGDGGSTWKQVDTVTYSDQAWRKHLFRLRDFVKPGSRVQVRFVAADKPDDSYCEALIDDLKVTDYDDGVRITLGGSTKIGQTAALNLVAARSGNRVYAAGVALGDSPGIPVAGGRTIPLVADALFNSYWLLPNIFKDFFGVLNGAGAGKARVAIPGLSGLVGVRFYTAFVTLQAAAPGGIRDISDSLMVTITAP